MATGWHSHNIFSDIDLFSTPNWDGVFTVLSHCLSCIEVRMLYPLAIYIVILYCWYRIKGCYKKMSKTLKEQTSKTDSMVLHNYVEMKENTERKPFTVSYA